MTAQIHQAIIYSYTRTFCWALMIVWRRHNITAINTVLKPTETNAITGKQPHESDLTFDQ